jgi:holo-[acyl-carrier protein] synthase
MTILGLGTDIVETARIEAMITRHGGRFLGRVFTAEEQGYCGSMRNPAPCYAARFAAKEAVSKAFGTGIGAELGWLDIAIMRDAAGKPSVVLQGTGAATAERLGITEVLISLSHSDHYAVAQAIAVGR